MALIARTDLVYRWRGAEDYAINYVPTTNHGLAVLEKVKKEIGVPLLTDVHETGHVAAVAQVVDILQIPAFLCRQTDLLIECGSHGRAVNIKKGQFLAAEDMKFAIEKVAQSGTNNVLATERGALFGYRDLVVDMRNLVIMSTT